MDFIVSKVAMSICALLLVGAMLGMFEGQDMLTASDELRDIAGSFRSLADILLSEGAEAELTWVVPYSASGEEIMFCLDGDLIRVSILERSIVENTPCSIHTWHWGGLDLNMTTVGELDAGSSPLRASSGTGIILSSVMIVLDNEQALMLFAR